MLLSNTRGKSISGISSSALGIFLFFILASTLIMSDVFIYKSLTPFYLYLIETSCLVVFTGIVLLSNPQQKIYFTWPVVLAFLLGCYVTVHGLLLVKDFNPFHVYLISSCSLLISIYVITQITEINLNAIFKIIAALALIESLICILQYWGLLHSYNAYFAVTGSWENPNVTAMFLALSVPAMFAIKKGARFIALLISILLIISLLLLHCRTAIIGAIFISLLALNHEYRFIEWLKDKRNRTGSALIIISVLIMAVPLTGYFYHAKKASADGRKLIWKLSADMILKKPLLGYGYGSFERNYNLAQSEYFKNGNDKGDESIEAGFVNMGYNEFLENTVEGGIIGIALVAAIFISLLYVPVLLKSRYNKTDNQYYLLYFGIAGFVVMSLVNFSFQAIPVMCLCMIYAGILANNPYFRKLRFTSRPVIYYGYRLLIGGCFILFGIYAVYFNVAAARASRLNQEASLLSAKGNYSAAIEILKPLETKLSSYESYWKNYGNLLLLNKDYTDALDKFNKAKFFTSNPDIYIKSARCYAQVGDFKDAANDYTVAEYIEPNRLAPRYDLMQLCTQLKDTLNAENYARQIISLTPKIKSKEATFYKYQAYSLLKRFGIIYNLPTLQANGSANNPSFKYN